MFGSFLLLLRGVQRTVEHFTGSNDLLVGLFHLHDDRGETRFFLGELALSFLQPLLLNGQDPPGRLFVEVTGEIKSDGKPRANFSLEKQPWGNSEKHFENSREMRDLLKAEIKCYFLN